MDQQILEISHLKHLSLALSRQHRLQYQKDFLSLNQRKKQNQHTFYQRHEPRFHHQWQPDRLLYETDALTEALRRELLERGHVLNEAGRPMGNVNAIGLDDSGDWLGAADPRRAGSARC